MKQFTFDSDALDKALDNMWLHWDLSADYQKQCKSLPIRWSRWLHRGCARCVQVSRRPVRQVIAANSSERIDDHAPRQRLSRKYCCVARSGSRRDSVESGEIRLDAPLTSAWRGFLPTTVMRRIADEAFGGYFDDPYSAMLWKHTYASLVRVFSGWPSCAHRCSVGC